ncbi:MAG TPA: sigma-70 family RNA polymerase sigma factor [Actinomycetota bacterium]
MAQETVLAPARAFEEFFEAERRRLFGAVYLMTGDVGEAEEILQDAFLAVWERWDRVREMEHADGYLFRTAMNGFRSRRRRLARMTRELLPSQTSEDPYERADLHDEVVRALRGLAPRQRAALVLTELLGFGSSEASELLGVRPTTIRNLAAQGRAALRRAMEHDHA